jgi:hypothetical protein
MRIAFVSLWVGIAVLGCGARGDSAEPPAATAGDESTAEPADSSAMPEAPQAVRRKGPATLTVVAMVAGQPTPASVRVLDAQGSAAGEGTSGSPITLAAGSYTLEVTISDASAMIDTPTQRSDLQLEAGQSAKIESDFAWAKVKLDVRVGGRSQRGAKVQLLRDGEPVAEMKSGAEPAPITPGRYEADVSLPGRIVRVTGLHFPDSATQTVPVHVK